MGENKTFPIRARRHPPRLSEEVAQSCCAPDFSGLQGTARSGCLIPLQAKKIKIIIIIKPHHSTTVVSLYQSPSTCCRRQGKPRDAEKKRNRGKLPSVRQRSQARGSRARLLRTRAGLAREARNRYWCYDSLSPSPRRSGPALPGSLAFRGGTRHRAQDSKHMKGTACGRWGGGAREAKKRALGSPKTQRRFPNTAFPEGLLTPQGGALVPCELKRP